MELTMYDTLLQLPLFQGLRKSDLTDILAKVKLHFSKWEAGETIVKQGDPCAQLLFSIGGTLESQTDDPSGTYTLYEAIESPSLIEPYSLFGMQQRYTATYRARTAANTVAVDKSFVFSHLMKYDIFHINFLNILSNRAQTLNDKLWTSHQEGVEGKIFHFISQRCLRPDGEKLLRIKMEDLAALIDETRINVSKALNDLQAQGLVELSRREIRIKKMRPVE